MIKQLKLKNFKSFKNEQTLNIAPITLIYGPNSSGKSSVIQSLLLLNQSILNTDAIKNNELASKGENLDLGLPLNFLHKGNTKSPMVISFKEQIDLSKRRINWRKKEEKQLPEDLIDLDLTLEFKQDTDDDPYSALKFQKIIYKIKTKENEIFEFSFIKFKQNEYKFLNITSAKNAAKLFIKYEHEIFENEDSEKIKNLKPLVKKITLSELSEKFTTIIFSNRGLFSDVNFLPTFTFRDFSKAEKNNFEYSFHWNRLMTDINFPIDRAIRSLNHISGLRNSPQRYYPLTNTRGFVGRSGENMAALLLKLSKGPNKNQLNKWLKKLEIPYQISVEPTQDKLAGSLLIMKLKDLRNNVEVTPSDVGIGISQILPLLIQGMSETANTSARNKNPNIRCVEQPELHLHPRLQANLADFFIDTVKQNPNLKWILETHSESLMLRLQKRIRNKEISKDQISVNYVNPVKGGFSNLIELRLDDEGDFIDEWPNGFFEEAYLEKFTN